MAAVGVTEKPGAMVELGEEERGVGVGIGVLVKKPVDQMEHLVRMLDGIDALAAEIGLDVGHQQGGGDSLPRDVAGNEGNAFGAEVEEIVIIAADGTGLHANPGVVQSRDGRQALGEKTSLDLLRDFEFLGGAALGFLLSREPAAPGFHFAGDLVEAGDHERVSVRIFEAAKGAAPGRGLQRHGEFYAALTELFVLGVDIFGDEGDGAGVPWLAVVRIGRIRQHQRQAGGAVGRTHLDPAVARGEAHVGDQAKTKLIDEKAQALFLVADVDGDELKAQKRILVIHAHAGAVALRIRPLRDRDDAVGKPIVFLRLVDSVGQERSPFSPILRRVWSG